MPVVADLADADRSSESASLAVIAALDVERRCLGKSGPVFFVLQSGPGAERAAVAARAAVSRGAMALISWGLAGSLESGVTPGTVLVPARVVNAEGTEMPVAHPWRKALVEALSTAFNVSEGALVSVDEVLENRTKKTAAALRFGAVACDMESAAIGAVARAAGVPFVVLRVIADAAADTLPRQVSLWVDSDGNRLMRPVLAAVLDPRQWKPLWVIARRFQLARASLLAIAQQLSPSSFLSESALPSD